MEIKDFSEIESEFLERVQKMVWCSVATVDSRQRPRSRILHPIWEGKTGWIGTHRTSYKGRHIDHNPYVSLAYIADVANPVFVDCVAEWVDDPAQKQLVWDLFKNTPEPVGYDPAPIFGDLETFGVLKLTPWRIDLVTFPFESMATGTKVWRASPK
ncbi:MAG: pyridoxamine 5'-phosphate oxidase family protein [Anaerolineae bacterium]|nr:pyridoxamine 5'-phosphate oxidase family protein [Anaerolineae bacterium]